MQTFLSLSGCIFNTIRYVDQFGVTFQPKVQNDSKYFKSVFSGVLTIIIHLGAFIYILQQLQEYLNGKILPRIQYQNVFNENLDEALEFSPFIVNIQYFGDEQLIQNKKFFDIKLSQQTYSTGETAIQDEISSDCHSQIPQLQNFCINQKDNSNLKLWAKQNQDNLDQNFLIITFYKCDPSGLNYILYIYITLKIRIVSMIIKQKNQQPKDNYGLDLLFQKKQYNINSKMMEIFQEVQYIPFDQSQYQAFNLNLVQQQVKSDNGIFYDDYEQKLLINGVNQQQQKMQIKQSQYFTLLQKEANIQIAICLSKEQNKLQIQKVKLGEVLASILSIYNLIMFTRYIGFGVNEQLLSHDIEEKIQQIYNKNYKQISIFYKWRMKISYYILGSYKAEFKLIFEQQNILKIFEQLSQIKKQEKIFEKSKTLPIKQVPQISQRAFDQSLSIQNQQYKNELIVFQQQSALNQQQDYIDDHDDQESQERIVNKLRYPPPTQIPFKFNEDL